MKRRILFSLLLCMALLFALPALAADEPKVLDTEEIDQLLAPYLEKYEATEKNLGIAFLYTGTGESYFLHEDKAFYSASLYKVPLCMHYAERISEGELDWSDKWRGQTLEHLISRTLLYSDNSTASGLMFMDKDILYDNAAFRTYCALSEEDLQKLGDKYQFTPRFMLNTLRTLYEEPERFPRIMDYLMDAAPGNYFEAKLEDRYDIAQKYGQWEGVLHTAGVIYTPTPILLVVMCDRLHGQREAIAEFAELFSDYALTLDARLAELKAEEEQRLKEEEEAARIAEEEAAQKAAAEKAARLAAEEAARTAAAEEKAQKLVEEAEAAKRQVLLRAAGCFALVFVLLLFAWLRRRRTRI